MKRSFLFLLLCMAACGHSMTYTPLNDPPRRLAPRAPASVEIYMANRPVRPGVEIGLIEIEQDSSMSPGTPEMIRKLREHAAQIGCDAVVVSGPSDRVQSYSGTSHAMATGNNGMVMGTHHGHANYVRSHRAACIVFTDGAALHGIESPGTFL